MLKQNSTDITVLEVLEMRLFQKRRKRYATELAVNIMDMQKKEKIVLDDMGENVPADVAAKTKLDADYYIVRKRIPNTNELYPDYVSGKSVEHVRYYLNVSPSSAPSIFKSITNDLVMLSDGVNQSIMSKISHPYFAGHFSDNIVIYVSASKDKLSNIEDVIRRIHDENISNFNADIPGATELFDMKKGIGKADNPGENYSYGSLISDYMAKAANKIETEKAKLIRPLSLNDEELKGAFIWQTYKEMNSGKFCERNPRVY